MNRTSRWLWTVLACGLAAPMSEAAKKGGPIWTDPAKAKAEDPDFSIQGEYGYAQAPTSEQLPFGVQVVAEGDGKFTAYVYKGGLPGAGWTGKKPVATDRKSAKARLKKLPDRWKLKGERTDKAIQFKGESHAGWIEENNFNLQIEDTVFELPRVERKSKTLGMEPPAGAIVLFDQDKAKQMVDNWEKGRITEDGLLMQGTRSKRKFGSHKLHLEFRTPYKPKARGQGRGNSGLYVQGRFETQILDSFGLIGQDNEAGGIYSIAYPRVNACLPPLRWQTYDIDFTAAEFKDGKKVKNARRTVHLNGILVHDDQELDHATTASPLKDTPGPGPVFLQNHGNPVRFRNIWVIEK